MLKDMSRHRVIIGIDEAGRGPLAGPVTVAFAAIPHSVGRRLFRGIRDSKRLSALQREAWFKRITAHPEFICGTASVGAATIDARGIQAAIRLATNRLAKKFPSSPSMVYLDAGLAVPETFPQRAIVRGDEKISIIAAASIIAKVTRDKTMLRLHRRFPAYRFDLHKGYGTALHRKQIAEHGTSPAHRKTFCRNVITYDIASRKNYARCARAAT